MTTLKAYQCGVKGTEYASTIHALSAGKAKYIYLLDLWDAWGRDGASFKDLTCKSLGAPRNTEAFEHTKKYRGVSFNIGSKVKVGESEGFVVDRNDSANFDVEFINGPYKGGRLNCHPSEIQVIA